MRSRTTNIEECPVSRLISTRRNCMSLHKATRIHMAVVAAKVIHFIRCVPVEVRVRQTEVCYRELPIT